MQWTLGKIGDVLRAAPPKLPGELVAGFSIDSRTIKPGEVFFAIRGPRHDGHRFVGEAFDRGAVGAVVSEQLPSQGSGALSDRLLRVADTFQALQELARFARRAWNRPVLAVTGSTGKTTTKEMLAALLARRYQVLKSEGNYNNEFGLPLTLLRLQADTELAVVELAMTHPGEIAKLCAVAEPNLGVVTNVNPVHLEFFSSVEEIAEAKRELIQGLREPATAVLNADDGHVRRFGEQFNGRVVFFGLADEADVRAAKVADSGCEGSEFDLLSGGQRQRIRLPLIGRHNVANALAAFAAASQFEISLKAAAEVFSRLEAPALRGQRLRFSAPSGGEGFTVINDAYNANPRAVAAMAEAISRTRSAKRRILVLGEMRELGETSPALHQETGELIARLGNVDILVGVTGLAAELVAGARRAGMPAARTLFFETKEEATEWLCASVREGDLILLKASRAIALETLVDAFCARFPLEVPAPAVKAH